MDRLEVTRKSWKRLFVLAGLALPLLAAGFAAWQLERARSSAARELSAALAAAFGGAGAVGSVREVNVAFARGGLLLRGIAVRAGPRTLLTAAESFVRPALGPLLRGHLELRALRTQGAVVQLQAEDLSRLARGAVGSGISAIEFVDTAVRLALSPTSLVELEHVSLRGSWTQPAPGAAVTGKGQLQFAALRFGTGALTTPTAVQWVFDGHAWSLASTLKLGSGSLGMNATFSAETTALHLRPAGVSLAQALPVIGLATSAWPALSGVVTGELDLRGTLSPLALTGSYKLSAQSLHAAQSVRIPQLTAAGTLQLTAAELRLEPVTLELGHSRLAGALTASTTDGLTAELRGEQFELSDLGPVWGVPLAGRGVVEISVGKTAAPHAHLALNAAAIGGKTVGQLNADLALDLTTGRLTLEHAQADSQDQKLTADGSTFDFAAAGLTQAHAALKVWRLPLRELYGLLGAADDPRLTRLQGGSAGSAVLTYRAATDAQPAALDLSLTLSLREIELAGYPFERGRLVAGIAIPDRRLGLAGGALTLSQLSLSAAAGSIELSGEIRRGQLAVRLAARGLPLERAPGLRSQTRSPLTGLIAARGTLLGDVAATRADLQLDFEGLRLFGEPLGKLELQALLRPASDAANDNASACRDSRAALANPAFQGGSAWLFCGDGLNGRAHVDLALGTGTALPLRGRVTLSAFALGPWLRGFAPEDPGAPASTLSAALEFTGGGLADLERASAALRVEKLVLGAGESRLENSAPFELRSREGSLQLAGAKLTGRVQHFTLSAEGALGKDARVSADGEVAASVFTRDSEPLLRAFGDVGVHLDWLPGARPALRGRATLRELVVRGPAELEARHLQGTLLLSGEHVTLEGVETELGGGKLSIAGRFDLDGLRIANYDFAIEAQRVALKPEPLIQLELDARTKLAWLGASALPALSGNLVVRKLAYDKPLHLEALAGLRAQKGAPARDRLALDLTVEQQKPVRVRNTFLDGELAIVGDHKLRIVGTDQRVGVLGELAVTRGRIVFQGDQFHFTRGAIALQDPTRIAPRFDVRAVADQPKRKDTSVVLSAQGTRDAFKVAVACDAGTTPVQAPPFICNYAHERMSCDDFERLIAQWACPTQGKAPSVSK